jgi:hypothetical protein
MSDLVPIPHLDLDRDTSTEEDFKSISVPSEMLSVNDYGSHAAIVRKLCLNGIPTFGHSANLLPGN